MNDNRRLSLVIPTMNRYDMTIESFAKVIDMDEISDIIIQDDASTDDSFNKLRLFFLENEKVRIYGSHERLGSYKNKGKAISHAVNDWCILLDSDNIIDVDYIDRLYALSEWDAQTVYAPDFSRPHFDYTA